MKLVTVASLPQEKARRWGSRCECEIHSLCRFTLAQACSSALPRHIYSSDKMLVDCIEQIQPGFSLDPTDSAFSLPRINVSHVIERMMEVTHGCDF